jgi:hypothetical protein
MLMEGDLWQKVYVSGLHQVIGEEGNRESCEQKAFYKP